MAVPVASVEITPVTNAGKGAKHQIVKGTSSVSFPPSHFNPVPIGSILQSGIVGTAYSEIISAQGGTPSYTFAVTSGSLPTGLSLAGGTGIISGTPTVAATSSFTITVTDSNGFTGSFGFEIIVTAPSGSNICAIY
jgi:large repetitive protein